MGLRLKEEDENGDGEGEVRGVLEGKSGKWSL